MRFFNCLKRFYIYVVILSILCGCSQSKNKISYDFCLSRFNIKCIKEDFKMEMLTSKGIIKFEINAKSAPVTSTYFLLLSNRGFYKGTSFNKVIKSPLPFIIQGGYKSSIDRLDLNRFRDNSESYMNSNVQAITSIPLEIKLIGEDIPRYNKRILKIDDLKRVELKHHFGSLSMARSQSMESSNAQFYISLKDLPELDGRYAVFGKVLEGFEVLKAINEDDFILEINRIGK